MENVIGNHCENTLSAEETCSAKLFDSTRSAFHNSFMIFITNAIATQCDDWKHVTNFSMFMKFSFRDGLSSTQCETVSR
ncbi:CLUMA_CG014606, isoform A [Clunio marinus]|uniref:CLUMA_CG014606, isoform A n=1 Tax=Clunio marinus TaxID=568069 RepID=A0A1J1IMA7_9DIPT|nr:CLUMA_CG014606, isoform A [Clunio marinus]